MKSRSRKKRDFAALWCANMYLRAHVLHGKSKGSADRLRGNGGGSQTGQMNDRMSVELLSLPIAEKRREEHEQFDIFYFYDLVYYADRKKQTEGYRAESIRNKHRAAIHLALLQHAREALIPQRPAEQKNPLMKAQWHFKRPQPDQGQAAVHPFGHSTFGSDGSSSSSTSTTAYLERKAKEDARDHAQEKREEQARLHQETGGRMVGVRYYEWDSIPKGNRVVKCNYCGAENLISERYKPNRYTCYFCREILE